MIELIQNLENLLGSAYEKIQAYQGAPELPGTVNHYVSVARAYLGGGLAAGFGLAPVNSMDPADSSGKVSPGSNGSDLSKVNIATTAVYFNGIRKVCASVTDFTVFNHTSLQNDESVNVVITVKDVSTNSNQNACEFNKHVGPVCTYSVMPQVPPSEVPIALVKYVKKSGQVTRTVEKAYYKVYYETPSDDDLILSVYRSVLTTESAQASLNRSAEFAEAMRSISDYFLRKTGKSLKDYSKSANYYFKHKFFKKLFSDVFRDHLPVELASITATTSQFEPEVFDYAQRLEVVLTGDLSAQSSNLRVFAVSPSYSPALTKARSSVSDTKIYTTGVSSWPNSGYAAVLAYPTWSVIQYARKTNNAELDLPTGRQLGTSIECWSKVYFARELVLEVPANRNFASTVLPLDSSNSAFLAVAYATLNPKNHSNLTVQVRNS